MGLLSPPTLIAAQSSVDCNERGVVTDANRFSRALRSGGCGHLVRAQISGTRCVAVDAVDLGARSESHYDAWLTGTRLRRPPISLHHRGFLSAQIYRGDPCGRTALPARCCPSDSCRGCVTSPVNCLAQVELVDDRHGQYLEVAAGCLGPRRVLALSASGQAPIGRERRSARARLRRGVPRGREACPGSHRGLGRHTCKISCCRTAFVVRGGLSIGLHRAITRVTGLPLAAISITYADRRCLLCGD